MIARVSPGMIAAMKTLPTDTARRSAMMISMMLGGMRIPRVPDAAMVPQARPWL